MKVMYYCPLAQQNGYARAAEDYCMALHLAGVEIAVRPIYDCDPNNLEDGYEELHELATRNLDPTHVVIHAPPDMAIRIAENTSLLKSGKSICITTWETSRMPRDFVFKLEQYYGAVVVPSEFSLKAIVPNWKASTDRLHVVPHCFDPDFWHPDIGQEQDDIFTFYTIGANSPRKNLEGLLRVYLTRFAGESLAHDVRLVVVCPDRGELPLLVEQIKEAAGLAPSPPVDIISQRLSNSDLRAIHAHADCYVTLSRGEGWGLGAFEAALMCNHVIASGIGGHEDFLVHADAQLIPCFLTPALALAKAATISFGGESIPLPIAKTCRPNGVLGDQYWGEPNLEWAGHAMLRAVKFDHARTKADGVYERFCEHYSYETVATRLSEVIGSL